MSVSAMATPVAGIVTREEAKGRQAPQMFSSPAAPFGRSGCAHGTKTPLTVSSSIEVSFTGLSKVTVPSWTTANRWVWLWSTMIIVSLRLRERSFTRPMIMADLGAHGRQRFVEEEDLGLLLSGPGHGEGLALAPGQALDFRVDVGDVHLDLVQVLSSQAALHRGSTRATGWQPRQVSPCRRWALARTPRDVGLGAGQPGQRTCCVVFVSLA
jgi:hypothetical protein